MGTQKHGRIVIAVVVVLALAVGIATVAMSGREATPAHDTGTTMEYASVLFDTDEVLDINIVIDEADWADMLANATAEEYHPCNVEVGGETFCQVGIRTKGNTSLSAIASDPDTDRYSFKLEFDQYVDGQTCFGLDKLVLNNNYADATCMKEALIYDMYQYLGADASLYNYAKVSINGEYWGVYLALEAVEDSFLLRNYGDADGGLYKPDSMDIGGGMDFGDMDFGGMDFGDMELPAGMENAGPSGFGGQQPQGGMMQMPDGTAPTEGAAPEMPEGGAMKELPEGTAVPELPGNGMTELPGGTMGMGGFSSSGGADLNYIDDTLDSYYAIWDGETIKTEETDHQRVVAALKNISQGTDLESSMDIDNLLRYMAVHVFSVNEDSLTGTMAHNYYLYESGGMLNLIPWDYNLAFGGMGGGKDAAGVVNSAIDNAFTMTTFFDALMENGTYHQQYYDYLRQLVESYVNGGGLDAFYKRVRSQLDTLVETDPTAFYSYDAYVSAAETLYQVVKLRGQSVLGQIEGTIPSTAEEQAGSDALVDASGLDISVMGTMDTGGAMGGGRGFDMVKPDGMADREDLPAVPGGGL